MVTMLRRRTTAAAAHDMHLGFTARVASMMRGEESMDRYLSTLLLAVLASGCSRHTAPSQTAWSEQESRDESRFGSNEDRDESPNRTSEMQLPQHRKSDEIASTTLPDLTRPNNPATQTTAGGLPGVLKADDPRSPEIMPGDRLVGPAPSESSMQEPNGVTTLPIEQKRNDLKITQEIRQALLQSDALSFTSKSVHVMTHNGEVTLSGKVPSARERSLILSFTKAHAGVLKVNNQIDVSNK